MDLAGWQLFIDASGFVKGVMIVLLFVSLISWAYIFSKWWYFRWIKKQIVRFEDLFWSGIDLNQLYQQHQERTQNLTGLNHVFYMGFKTFSHFSELGTHTPDQILSSTRRALDVAIMQESSSSDKYLSYFATVASVCPFIGLLGTVWGIMHSFVALGGMQQVSLAMVAPGIAEALVATAMGLIAAIPASIAYNFFAKTSDDIKQHYYTFNEELLNILQRQTVQRVSE